MRPIAFDTNVLAYAARIERVAADRPKLVRTAELLDGLRERVELVVPAQAMAELFNLLRRLNVPVKDARVRTETAVAGMRLLESALSDYEGALDLAVAHRLGIWDALIVNVAARHGARWLLSEDMQDGFRWRGLTILNPYARAPAELIEELGLE